ncbi:5'-AMP-activated protein kinase beta subunit, interation domain-containing protein [Kalaharituber pfeilii]|nr:5'-AMP-activated protein kinase beta subunit, interation domain-containing protein [Kalaharituber pfeilii]
MEEEIPIVQEVTCSIVMSNHYEVETYDWVLHSPDSNMLSAIVPLPAGTHHVKFLVDGELRTSDALPTAVDSTGILVNYLEINADDMLAPLERQPSPIEAEGPSFQAVQDATQNPHHSHSHTYSPGANDHHHHHSHSAVSNTDEPFGFIKPRPQRYTDTIPAYLRDFEENQDRYAVSGSALNPHDSSGDQDVIKIPPPPALPLMLGKVILNSSSHLKDDNSVLGIPNHVVLNHLATSSIKNHVLAVSATTSMSVPYCISRLQSKGVEMTFDNHL